MQPRNILTALSVLILWLTCSFAWANSSIILPQGSFDYAISPYISIYEDTSRELTIGDIVSLKYQLFFSPVHSDSLKLGVSDSNFWFRFTVTNPYEESIEAIFTLSDSDFDLVNIYQIESNTSQYQEITQQAPERAISGGMKQFFTLRMELPANSSQTYILQLHSIGLLTTHVGLMSMDHFIANEQLFFLFYGLAIGLFIMAAWGFFYVWSTFHMRIAFFSMLLCAIAVIYMAANLGALRLFVGVSGFNADKIAEFSLGLVYLLHILTASSLEWRGRYKQHLRLAIYTLALSALPASVLIVVFFSEAAMPLIAQLLVFSSFITAIVLTFAKSTTPISQLFLMIGYWFSAIAVLILVLTSYNLLAFSQFSAWGEMIIPLGILLSLIKATVYQLPSYRIAQRSKPLDGLEGSILTQVGHDILTPVNSLIGTNELILDTPLSAKQRELIETAEHATLEILHHAQQITDLGCLQEHQFQLNIEAVATYQFFNKIITALYPEANRKHIELILNIQDLPETIHIDYKRLYTAVYNIVSMAITHSDHGDISLKVYPYGNGKIEGIRLQLQISNIMVRPEILRSSFSILQKKDQLQPLSRSQWQLSLTRLLLSKMRASLDVESMTARGASISLVIPLTKPVSYQPVKQSKQFDLINNRSILIVDDSTSLRSMLENQTKHWGMKVQGTYSSKEALAHLRNQSNLGTPFDFILVDHERPFLDALQLSERIRQDDNISQKPLFLMLHSQDTAAIQNEAMLAGIDLVLTKPANTEHLLQALLELASSQQEDL